MKIIRSWPGRTIRLPLLSLRLNPARRLGAGPGFGASGSLLTDVRVPLGGRVRDPRERRDERLQRLGLLVDADAVRRRIPRALQALRGLLGRGLLREHVLDLIRERLAILGAAADRDRGSRAGDDLLERIDRRLLVAGDHVRIRERE